jgi:hypothetical protein
MVSSPFMGRWPEGPEGADWEQGGVGRLEAGIRAVFGHVLGTTGKRVAVGRLEAGV